MQPRWNHNVQYHKVVRQALDPGPLRVLDVGAGEGALAGELSSLGHQVTAIDVDEAVLLGARSRLAGSGVRFVLGDFMSHPFEPDSFDAVVSIAVLHHMPEREALERMATLVRPGGVVAVVGVARSRVPQDLAWDLGGAILDRWLRRRRGGFAEVSAPVAWPPPGTFHQVRRLAAVALPGVRFRRHLLWRYSLVWTKGGEPAGA